MKIALGVCGLSVVILLTSIFFAVRANYEYQAQVEAEWNLADKSSTISAKREHLDKFVAALERQNLSGSYNALLFPTPNNSFDANFAALQTLQTRLHEIEGMDVKSFEYQTAIQQITAQEQGEAHAMLSVFEGAWYLQHHFLFWDWVGVLWFVFWSGAVLVLGVAVIFQLMD